MGEAAAAVGQWLAKNWKWIALVIVLIILYYAARRNWYKIKFYFQPRNIDIAPGENTTVTPGKERELKDLAQNIYTDIYDTPFWGGHDVSLYEAAMALSDTDLLYLAKFYRINLTHGITLYDDMNNEVYVFTDINTRLKGRLSKIGEGSKGDSRFARTIQAQTSY